MDLTPPPPRREGIRRVVVVVPSFFTLANLFFGFWSIVSAFNGNFKWAGFFIVFAGILDVLDGRCTLILVDAVCSGEPAGAVHRLQWPDVRLRALRPGSTHSLRPAEAVQLAATLGVLPPRVIVFGIEAARFDPGAGLSPEVAASVAVVVRRIREELEHARDVVAARTDEPD